MKQIEISTTERKEVDAHVHFVEVSYNTWSDEAKFMFANELVKKLGTEMKRVSQKFLKEQS